tara:strand:- start:3276 stop:4061 length:786 start_codon:yes stop_codon:yes gene_type:complete
MIKYRPPGWPSREVLLERVARVQFTLGSDVRFLWTELGVSTLAVAVGDAALESYGQLGQRSQLLHARFGVAPVLWHLLSLSCLLINATSFLILLWPRAYWSVGAVLPTVLLATVMVAELALAGDAALHGSTVYAVAVGASLVLLGLFRLDRRARNASLQVPTGEAWQYAEERVRGVCTAFYTGVFAPVVGVSLLSVGLSRHAYWHASALARGHQRAMLRTQLALAALAFLLAAQDGSARLFRVQKLRQRWDRWTGTEHKLL